MPMITTFFLNATDLTRLTCAACGLRLRAAARARPALDEVFERAGRRRAWRAAEWRCDRSPSAL